MGSTLHSEFGMPKGRLQWGNSTRDGEPRLKASLWNRNTGLDIVRMGWGKESRMRGGGPAPCEAHRGASEQQLATQEKQSQQPEKFQMRGVDHPCSAPVKSKAERTETFLQRGSSSERGFNGGSGLPQ